MMGIERLHKLFDDNPDKTAIEFEGNCHDCGCAVTVHVFLTSEGFSIQGGAMFEPEPEQFFTK